MPTVKFVSRNFSIVFLSLVGPGPGVTTSVASEVQCQSGSPEGLGQGTDRDCDRGRDRGRGSVRFVEGKVCLGESIHVRAWDQLSISLMASGTSLEVQPAWIRYFPCLMSEKKRDNYC